MPLAVSMQTSPKPIREIYLQRCHFDETASKDLPTMFARGSSRDYILSLDGNVQFPKDNDNQVVFELVTSLKLTDFCYSRSSKNRFRAIVHALTSKSCVLDRFVVTTEPLCASNVAVVLNAIGGPSCLVCWRHRCPGLAPY
jgi:hypothetical protein